MNDEDIALWAHMVNIGTTNAVASLSKMVGQEIKMDSFTLTRVPVEEISNLMGGPEVRSVGVYLTVSGAADGHIMLMYEPDMAYGFVDLLMGAPAGTTTGLGEMEQSALGELGTSWDRPSSTRWRMPRVRCCCRLRLP